MKRQGRVFMWLDNASDIDILFYEPYARIIADIAKNEQYNPLTVGVFGLWGAGKSTLLKLIGEKLKSQDGIICVTINAWMFESYDDAKTAIMEALLQELKEEVPVEETKKKLGKLIKRVDWFKLGTKAISTLAPVVASVATGNPLPMLLNVTGSAEEIGNTVKNAANSIQSLKDEYWKEEDASNDESTINNIRKFREEFSDALKSDDIKNVVVMIDDLDRCRPERIIEILEVIKLFLSVDRTTFIIAADENVIKYSIREKYPPMNGFDVELDKEYIEKIIQLPIYIPELSAKDIQNYLLLLVTQSYLEQESFKHLIDKIFEEKRTISGDVITLEEINKSIGELGLNWQDGGQTAFNETAKIIDEIREIVASTLKGNPRQAKRFLNTFITKRQLAKIYYGDEIDISILAKLLVLQKLDNDLFITNFFAYNTKREIVGQVKDTDAFKSCYADTISCSHPCLARYNKKGSKEYPVNCGYCYPCLIRKSSLLDIDEIKKYSYQGEAYDFLIEYEESEKSADLRAVLGSIYRCKHSSDKELKRYIRCVGELTEEEVEKFLSLYKKSIEDLVQLFSADQRMKEYLGL